MCTSLRALSNAMLHRTVVFRVMTIAIKLPTFFRHKTQFVVLRIVSKQCVQKNMAGLKEIHRKV